MNPFLNAHLYAFRKAWQAYARQRPRYQRLEDNSDSGYPEKGRNLADAWKHGGHTLQVTWKGFVSSVVAPQSALALRLYLACRERIMGLWLRPGGYFYTRHGNLRRGNKAYLARVRKKLTPKVPENLRMDLERAECNWALAQEVESARVRPSRLRRWLKGDSDFEAQLLGVMVVASGAVTGRPDEPTLLNGIKRKALLWPSRGKGLSRHWWRQRWGWQRIAGMKAAGWLESFGDGRRLK